MGDFGAVYKTTNGGVTWLPQIFTSLSFREFSSPELYYFENNGKGLLYKFHLDKELDNFLVTNDSGNTFQSKKIKELTGYNSAVGNPCIIKVDSVYYFYLTGQQYIYNWTKVFKLDSQFNFISSSKIDSIHIFDIQKLSDNRFTAIGLDRRYPKDAYNYDSSGYYILYSDDGLNWKKDFKIDLEDWEILGFNKPDILDDLMLIGGYKYANYTQIYNLFIADLKNKKTYNIMYGDSSTDFRSFANLGSWTFCGSGRQVLYYNNDLKNNSSEWEQYDFRPYRLYQVYNFGKTSYATALNGVKKRRDLFRLTLKEGTSVVETPVEDRTYLYAYPAYPQPASETVSSRVYWDYGYDINDADMNVYDVTGQKVSGRGNITISKTDETSGILNWNCKEFPAGIYLIRIRLGGSTKTIRAAVIK